MIAAPIDWPRRALAALLALTIAVSGVLISTIPAARADDDPPPEPVPITAGAGLDWGLKASWRNYIGEAGTTFSEGASRNEDGTFHFPIVSGTFDPSTNETIVQFAGAVGFLGHCEPNPTGVRPCALDLTIRNPRIVLGPDELMLWMEAAAQPVDGELVFEDIPFAALDVANAESATVDGVTTWGDIGSRLTQEAAAVFTYAPGTLVDPVAFSYEGPGGVPVPSGEQLNVPGEPLYVLEAQQPLGGEGQIPFVDSVVVDAEHDVIHTFGRFETNLIKTVPPTHTLDASTLEVLAQTPDTAERWNTFFPSTVTDFATGDTFISGGVQWAGSTRILRWDSDAETLSYETPAGFEAVAPDIYTWDEANQRIVALSARNAPYGGGAWVATRAADGSWTTKSYTYPEGIYFSMEDVPVQIVATPEGEILASPSNSSYSGASRIVQVEFPDEGTEAVVTDVAGTARYASLAVTPGGSVYAMRADASANIVRLAKTEGVWGIVGDPIPVGTNPMAFLADPTDDDTILVAPGGARDIQIVRNGAVVSTITVPGTTPFYGASPMYLPARFGIGSDHRLVVADHDGISTYKRLGVAPEVTTQPESRSVALGVADTSEPVTFTADAVGEPAPAQQWQSRPAGSDRWQDWTDVPGETGTTLTVEATRALDGTQYRALFTNEVDGEPLAAVASDAATLTVDHAPSVVNQTGSLRVVEGQSADFLVMPAGHPEPAITWQRLVAGFWQDVTTDASEVVLDGGFLRIPETTLAMDGARFRAKLTNSVATVFSNPVTLRVDADAPPEPGFPGDGTGTWGIRESYRNYISGPIGHGQITVDDGVTWLDGPGTGKGPFTWPVVSASFDPDAVQGVIAFGGSVSTVGHDYGQGYILEATWSDLHLDIDGATGTLYADLSFRPFAGANPTIPPPPLQSADDVAFATVDLSGVDWTPGAGRVLTIADAPATGVLSTMELIGWDQFYSSELPTIGLDALSVSFRPGGDTPAPPTFTDVSEGDVFFDEITWLAGEGITVGYEDGTFRPVEPVSRQSMAAFLWRMAGSPAPLPDAPRFSDVADGDVFAEPIAWLAGEGITTGFGDGTFRPVEPVSRQSMAAFLWRMAGSPAPDPDAPRFSDVADGDVFAEAISWLAGTGITTGYEDGTFRGAQEVTRQTMAAFLYRYQHQPVG